MRKWGTVRVGALVTVGALLMVGLTATAHGRPAPRRTPDSARSITVGTVHARRCHLGVGRPTWCGSLRLPLDYTDPTAPRDPDRVRLGAEPTARDGHARGAGGRPRLPLDRHRAATTRTCYGGLLRDHDLLVVDARGTGRSTPLRCPRLQRLPSPSPRFPPAVTACAQQLNHTWRRADGTWVHASDLFTTANSARDVARMLAALRIGKVDLYGDSYGTYFAQSFLSRYPGAAALGGARLRVRGA